MNARIERVMNSENLGARIMENGALDQKMWLWKLSGAKQSSGIFEVVGEFWRKR
jgi:hypothetical protein